MLFFIAYAIGLDRLGRDLG